MRERRGQPVIKKVKKSSAAPEDASIYKKKYYKVTLLSIDPRKETPESFAIKMSIRLRTPMPRVKQLLKRMPCTLKSGMSVSQANKLFAVMEELGARVKVEDYYLAPGEAGERAAAVDTLASKGTKIGTASSFICPSCGWENEAGSHHCPLCLLIFRREHKAPSAQKQPERQPEDAPPAVDAEPSRDGLVIINTRWLVLAGVLLAVLLAVLILK